MSDQTIDDVPLLAGFNPTTWPALIDDMWAEFDRLREEHRFYKVDFGPDPIWMILRYEDQHAALQDYELFSSANVTAGEANGMHQWIPEELDPPMHGKYRQLLVPFFAPAAVKALEPQVRAWCVELIERFAGDGRCDFVEQFARLFPTTIFMGLMGLPIERAPEMLDWVDELMHTPADKDPDGAIRMGAVGKIMMLLNELIEDRLANPRDDIATTIVTATIDGEPMPREHMLQMAFLLYMGGLDTVAGELGCFFRHFALHPQDRQYVVDHPERIPDVVEELLRAYSIVNTGRIVTRDADWNGCPMKQGDRIFVPLPSGGRDPREFDNATGVDFERERNRHMAFGAGPHRCLGSYLARAELVIAVEEWHRRIPAYSLAEGEPLGFHVGGVAGYDRLPLVW